MSVAAVTTATPKRGFRSPPSPRRGNDVAISFVTKKREWPIWIERVVIVNRTMKISWSIGRLQKP